MIRKRWLMTVGILMTLTGIIGLACIKNAKGNPVLYVITCIIMLGVGIAMMVYYQSKRKQYFEELERKKEKQKQDEALEQERKELELKKERLELQAKENARTICPHCGAATRGRVCEYCGCSLEEKK